MCQDGARYLTGQGTPITVPYLGHNLRLGLGRLVTARASKDHLQDAVRRSRMPPDPDKLQVRTTQQVQPCLLSPVGRRDRVHHREVADGLVKLRAHRGKNDIADEQLGVALRHGGPDAPKYTPGIGVVPVVEHSAEEVGAASCDLCVTSNTQ